MYTPTMYTHAYANTLSLSHTHTLTHIHTQEHLKIIYYFPEEEIQNRKVRNIGLCEALVHFTKTFHPSRPCEAVHTQRLRQVFYEAEPDHWMIMVGCETMKV